jgi:hypothetical protein
MYYAPSDIIATACGHHIIQAWPGASGKQKGLKSAPIMDPIMGSLLQSWPSPQYAWVPAYIAYGLLENARFDQNLGHLKAAEQIRQTSAGKDRLAPKDQELHQQMLQKLALHLASQPDLQPESSQSDVAQNEKMASQRKAEANVPSSQTECSKEALAKAESRKAEAEVKGSRLSAQDQEFQQEMLCKLALHLAAQENSDASQEASKDTEKVSREVRQEVSSDTVFTPEVFPATPSSFGDSQCEHYFIGDDDCDQDDRGSSACCLPPSSRLVSVPMSIAQGLLGGILPGAGDEIGKSKQDHEFHQQMLQKLALHLVAQSEPLQKEESRPERAQVSATLTAKMSWADMMDDDDEMLEVSVVAPKAQTHANDVIVKAASTAKHTSLGGESREPDKQFQQDMLRKLALHLAAQPEVVDQYVDGNVKANAMESPEEAKAVGEDKAQCDRLIAEMEEAASARSAEIVEWALPGVRALSLTQSGCRLVQKVIDVASSKQREQLLEALLQDVAELYSSPHGNHVIAKLIEIMPTRSLASIGDAMRGKATTIARHQFGSRILERLIEHCGEDDIGFLLDELLGDVEALARHQFGNFVVARLLEHSLPLRKQQCVEKLLPHVLQHATHKTACNIVQRLLEHADLSHQAMIADAFLTGRGDTSLEVIAATRYGSFVIQHLVDKFHPRIDAVKARVKAAHSQLQQSGFSQRKIVQFLGESFFSD